MQCIKKQKILLKINSHDSESIRGEKLILNGMKRDYFQREELKKGFELKKEFELKKNQVPGPIINDTHPFCSISGPPSQEIIDSLYNHRPDASLSTSN